MPARIYFGTPLPEEKCQDAPHAASYSTPWASPETPLTISSYAIVRCQFWDQEKRDYVDDEPREVILLEGGGILPESLVLTTVRAISPEGVNILLQREGSFNKAYHKLADQYSMWSINHISVADYTKIFNDLFAGLRIHSAYRKTYRKSVEQKTAWNLMELDFVEGDEAIFEQRWADYEAGKLGADIVDAEVVEEASAEA